jgi:hypothetical protein
VSNLVQTGKTMWESIKNKQTNKQTKIQTFFIHRKIDLVVLPKNNRPGMDVFRDSVEENIRM